jgi:DUF4097 and DUF4098 domain-containing protein YvlB
MRPHILFGFVLFALLAAAQPARADFRLERHLTLASGGNFVLEADGASVTISGDSTSGAAILITSRNDNADDRYDFQFQERGGEVRVTAKRRDTWRSVLGGDWFNGGLQIAVHVPRATAVDIKTSGGSVDASGLQRAARLRSSGGSLRIDNVEGDVDGRTSGGSVRVRQVRGVTVVGTSGGSIEVTEARGDVRAHTSGGGIRVDGAAGEVEASTSGGSVQIRQAAGRVEAHTSGGPITVSFAPGNNRGGELSTSGGGVSVEVDPRVAMTIDASASGGGVTADVPVTVHGEISRRQLRGDLNGGGPVLRMHTSGGGVRISATR